MSQSKTPKIRFPEFTEDWQKKRLDEIFTERKESCIISEEYPQLAFTIAEGVINPEDKKTNKRDFLIKDIETKKFAVTEVDDIIYNPANLKFGAIHRNKLKRGGVSPIYAIFSTEQLPAFMEYLVKRPSFIQESLKYLEGTVIRLMTLKPRDFLLMKTYIPSIPEQEKIADLFTTLDSYIEIETKKTDSYKTLKASMLQKMFPQQGTSEPEIRFPGFTEPWEQRKLSDAIVDIADGPFGSNLKTEHYTDEKEARIIQLSNLSDYGWQEPNTRYTTFEHAKEIRRCIVNEGELVMGKMMPAGMTIIRPNTEKMYVLSSDCVRIKLDKNVATDEFFLYTTKSETFLTQVNNDSQGSTRVRTSISKIREMDFATPSLEEQAKIGEYFTNLDNLITLHQRKCEQLQLLKHSLQQKMFV